MKIAIADNCGGKFSADIKEHWIKKGHEVKYERGASEHLAQWADLYYIDFWDNNIHYLYKLYHGQEKTPEGWDNNKKPKVVVRAIDWEVWIGLARDQSIIDWVDEVICITPHIEKELRKHADFKDKIHCIRPGVNSNRFTLKKAQTDGFQLGMVLGDMWWPKNHMGGLDIFTTLYQEDPRWKLHIRGQHEGGEYWKVMYDHYITSRQIQDNVILYNQVEDMNEWYEKIDVLLHPGMKEAFCYAVGEAMMKGIPAIVNNFYGYENIWDYEYSYNTHKEAVEKIKNSYREKQSTNLRRKLILQYGLDKMLKNFDELLGT